MSPVRVAVLGSGFAGLETAFLLRSLVDDDQVRITVVSDQDEFLFKPNTIYLPFGGAEGPLHLPLAKPLAYRHITQRIGTVEGIDADRAVVHTSRGLPVHYDRLVIATGATMRPDGIPGLAEHAHQIWTPGQMHRLGEAVRRVARLAAHGRPQRVLFVVPPNNKCAGPLYEIVFMLDTWLQRHNVRRSVDITFTTYERSFIQAFGPRLHEVVTGEFADREILGYTGAVVSKIGDGQAVYTDGTEREFDLLVAFPPYAAAMRYEGLPADDRGFLTCDPGTRAVAGHPEIFAPGDAGDFPVKQAFLAFLQADAVAGTIAAGILGSTSDSRFQPTSMCVMEMLDKATFAQVPLMVTGDPAAPVAVDPAAPEAYRVGTGKIWRLGKKALGLYLPMRFGRGQPFHAGAPWRAMELGLRAGSRWLAS